MPKNESPHCTRLDRNQSGSRNAGRCTLVFPRSDVHVVARGERFSVGRGGHHRSGARLRSPLRWRGNPASGIVARSRTRAKPSRRMDKRSKTFRRILRIRRGFQTRRLAVRSSFHPLRESDARPHLLCHDYPSAGSQPQSQTTIAEQKAHNAQLSAHTSEMDYVTLPMRRDATLNEPRLLEPSLQVNICAGKLPDWLRRGDG
jgi:hypothetical protein